MAKACNNSIFTTMALTLKNIFFEEIKKSEKWYHGTNSNIGNFSIENVGKGHDQEGPGVYFTTSRKDAASYGKNIISVKVSPKRLVPSRGEVESKIILHLMRRSPGYADYLSNWDEDEHRAEKMALESILGYNGEPQEVFKTIWAEFYRNAPKAYLEEMMKIGFDGHIVEKQNNVKHLILYNPAVIKTKTRIQEAKAERDEQFRSEASKAFEKFKDFLSGPKAYAENLHFTDKFGGAYIITSKQIEWDYPELNIMLVSKNNFKYGGGLTRPTSSGAQFLVLPLIDEKRNPENELEGVSERLVGMTKTFIHEFIHFLDLKRHKNKNVASSAKIKNTKGNRAYVNDPKELNAYYQEAVHEMAKYFETAFKHKPEIIERNLKSFDVFYEKIKKYFTKGFLENLEPKNEKKILQRLYGFYEHLKIKYNI
jgi:hypothetical protein